MDPRSSRAVRDRRRLSRKNSAADKEQEEELARKAMVSKAAALTGIANHMAELSDQMLAGLRAAHVQTPPAAKVNTLRCEHAAGSSVGAGGLHQPQHAQCRARSLHNRAPRAGCDDPGAPCHR